MPTVAAMQKDEKQIRYSSVNPSMQEEEKNCAKLYTLHFCLPLLGVTVLQTEYY